MGAAPDTVDRLINSGDQKQGNHNQRGNPHHAHFRVFSIKPLICTLMASPDVGTKLL